MTRSPLNPPRKANQAGRLAALAWLLIANASAAWAGDAGLATRVVGDVQLAGNKGKLAPLSRIAKDEHLRIPSGGLLQVTYLASGRQETWAGPCTVTAGERQGAGEQCATPAIKQLPPSVMAVVLRSPEAMSDLHTSAGMVRIKAAPDLDAVREMNATYQQLRAQASEDDITPELYLLARQMQLGLLDAAQATADEMYRRQPENADIKELLDRQTDSPASN